jgi:hypothetical protein
MGTPPLTEIITRKWLMLISFCFRMSILSRAASSTHPISSKFTTRFNHVFRFVRSLESTATDSTVETMDLDSESQQEDPGYEFCRNIKNNYFIFFFIE